MLKKISMLFFILLTEISAPLYAANKPLIIAHRAGLADALENSLPAIELALKNGADMIWITIQITKDEQPVLYRPDNLSELTTGNGLISHYTAGQLAVLRYKDLGIRLNHASLPVPSRATNRTLVAGEEANPTETPVKNSEQFARIPTLSQVLTAFPTTHFYLDLKAPDADPHRFAAAIDRVIAEHDSYRRTTIYSTNKAYSDAFRAFNQVQRMVARAVTREILAVHLLSQQCISATTEQGLHGFEMARDVTLIERFKLGIGETKTIMRINQQTARCLLSMPANKLILFGINTLDDYYKASHYGAFAVMVDSPLFFDRNIIHKEWSVEERSNH